MAHGRSVSTAPRPPPFCHSSRKKCWPTVHWKASKSRSRVLLATEVSQADFTCPVQLICPVDLDSKLVLLSRSNSDTTGVTTKTALWVEASVHTWNDSVFKDGARTLGPAAQLLLSCSARDMAEIPDRWNHVSKLLERPGPLAHPEFEPNPEVSLPVWHAFAKMTKTEQFPLALVWAGLWSSQSQQNANG